MEKRLQWDVARVERNMDRMLTPKGITTIVLMILLAAMLLSTSGIERRTLDAPGPQALHSTQSPLLGTP